MAKQSVPAKEVADQVMKQDPVYILDVRDEESFEDWQIEGKGVHLINIPFKQLEENDLTELADIQKEGTLYTVCAKGNTSEKAAEFLSESRFEGVHSIEGGMEAWSEQLEPVKVGDIDGGAIYQFNRLGKGCLSYVIESDGEAAVIDASRMTEVYLEFAEEKGINIIRVLDTHLHADHISGGKKLAEQAGASYYLPEKDASEVVFDFEPVKDGMKLSVGKSTIETFYSPGHTIGSTTFIVDGKYLLTGDILFVESIGRPDLAGKAEDWAKDLYETLSERYKDLTGDFIVLPAHYATVSEMKEDSSVSEKLSVLYSKNEGLQIKDESSFIDRVTEGLKDQPNAFEEIRQTNMGRFKPEPDKAKEMETGPNNCAV